MTEQIVQTAHDRLRSRYTEQAWYALSPRALTDALYQEIRQIDAQRLADLRSDNPNPVPDAAAASVEEHTPDAANGNAGKVEQDEQGEAGVRRPSELSARSSGT